MALRGGRLAGSLADLKLLRCAGSSVRTDDRPTRARHPDAIVLEPGASSP